MHLLLSTILTFTLLPSAISASPPMSPLSLSPATLSALAHPLTCPQVTSLNNHLDSFIHYAFPASVPPEKAYAVASFTHGYKVLLNNMHGNGCATSDTDGDGDMGLNATAFLEDMKKQQGVTKRQGDTVTAILCVIVDTLLGDNGGEAIPTSNGGSGVGAGLPTVSVTVSDTGMGPMETGVVKRQDNNGDEGIVEDLLELVGTILQIILGCEIGEEE
ncbi:hypothetical protein BDV06DRAFT_221580 [Aspergillus oleicola]